jgi:hypothetical protein
MIFFCDFLLASHGINRYDAPPPSAQEVLTLLGWPLFRLIFRLFLLELKQVSGPQQTHRTAGSICQIAVDRGGSM